MRLYVRFFLALIMVGACFVLLGVASQDAPKPDGAALYKQKCAMCHGVDGKGFPAIKSQDFTDPKWQAATKDKAIITITKFGKKGSVMPGFDKKMTEEEILAVVAHIRTLNSEKKK